MAIVVSTPQDLEDIRNNLSGHYIQANDIDLSGHLPGDALRTWNPIDDFTGIYDGNGYSITGVKLNRLGHVGFFGTTASGLNTIIRNVNLSIIDSIGGFYVGSLVGVMQNGRIENCHVSGGSVTGQDTTGGFVGVCVGVEFYDCRCACNVIAEYLSSDYTRQGQFFSPDHGGVTFTIEVATADTGGFIGAGEGVVMDYCYSIGDVVAADDELENLNWYGIQVGGLIGNLYGQSSVSKCYSLGEAKGSFSIGCFVGAVNEADIDNSFSQGTSQMHTNKSSIYITYEGNTYRLLRAIGGFVGQNVGASNGYVHCYSATTVDVVDDDVVRGYVAPWDWGWLQTGGFGGYGHSTVVATSNYYDSDITNHEDNYIADPKTTAEMQTQETFAGWDFVEIWDIETGYPFLRWPSYDVEVAVSQIWVKKMNRWVLVVRN